MELVESPKSSPTSKNVTVLYPILFYTFIPDVWSYLIEFYKPW